MLTPGEAIEDATQQDVHREFQNDELNAFLMLLCAAHAAGAQEVQERFSVSGSSKFL